MLDFLVITHLQILGKVCYIYCQLQLERKVFRQSDAVYPSMDTLSRTSRLIVILSWLLMRFEVILRLKLNLEKGDLIPVQIVEDPD